MAKFKTQTERRTARVRLDGAAHARLAPFG